ncbi:MAG: methyl-accepting chemotaxis protein [Bacteroidota bacterium]
MISIRQWFLLMVLCSAVTLTANAQQAEEKKALSVREQLEQLAAQEKSQPAKNNINKHEDEQVARVKRHSIPAAAEQKEITAPQEIVSVPAPEYSSTEVPKSAPVKAKDIRDGPNTGTGSAGIYAIVAVILLSFLTFILIRNTIMNWLNNLKISSKLMLAFSLVCIIATIIGYVGFSSTNDMAAASQVMYEKQAYPIGVLANMDDRFQRIRVNTRDVLLATTDADMEDKIEKIKTYREEIDGFAKKYETTIMTEAGRKKFEEFVDARKVYGGYLDELISLAKSGKDADGFKLLNGDMAKASRVEQDLIFGMLEQKMNLAEASATQNSEDAQSASMQILVILAFGVVVSFGLGLFIARSIANPVNDVVQNIKNADLHSQFNSTRKDEIGLLQQAFDGFVLSIKQTLVQVSEASAAVASASTQISSSTEELAAGAQEQSSQSAEVAGAVEEMTKTIMENSRNAGDTATTAKKAKDTAVEGGDVVRQTVDGMKEIAKVVNKSADTVKALGKSSDQIGEIISVIDDIADQTNLLALNAAIEAARAGEQGRGFAVVADEVRKLAERTTKATKEIASMIKQIQTDTKEAVISMDEGTKKVGEGITLADRAGASLEQIVGISQMVTDKIAQIAAASEQQSSASEQISKNVEAISAVTQQSASGTQQIARTAEDLNRLTENLQELLAKFNLNASADSSRRESTPVRQKSYHQKSKKAVSEHGQLVEHH